MLNQNKYQQADEDGRKIFREYCATESWCKVIRESKDEYAHWDVSFYSGSTKIIGEIKKRDYDSNDFSFWDYEKDKHDNLLKVYKKCNEVDDVEIQYINIYNNDVIRIWTTTNTHNEQVPVEKMRNKSKMENKGDVPKLIYNLKIGRQNEAHRGILNKTK